MYFHHRAMFRDAPAFYLLAILLITALGLGLVIIVAWYVFARNQTLRIEGGRIIYRQGVLSKDHVEMSIFNVRSVRVDQTFFQRILDVGTIYITSSGSEPEIVARGMPEVAKARDLLGGRTAP